MMLMLNNKDMEIWKHYKLNEAAVGNIVYYSSTQNLHNIKPREVLRVLDIKYFYYKQNIVI